MNDKQVQRSDKKVQRSTNGDNWNAKIECQPLADEIKKHLDKPGLAVTATVTVDCFTLKTCKFCQREQSSKTDSHCRVCRIPFI